MPTSARFRWLIAVSLSVPLALVCLSAWVSYDALESTRSSARWVVRTYEVRERLRDVMSDLQDVETGQRGYLLTHQESFLEPHEAAEPRIPLRLAELQTLLAGKPLQMEHLGQLQSLAKDKVDHVNRGIDFEKAGNHDAAVALVNSGYGQSKMTAIRQVMAAMNREEDRLLAEREGAFSQRLGQNQRIAIGVVAVQLTLITLVGALLWRVTRLQRFVTACAWSKTIKYEGEWISFEQYLERQFGLQVTHGINPAEAKKLLDELRARREAERAQSG